MSSPCLFPKVLLKSRNTILIDELVELENYYYKDTVNRHLRGCDVSQLETMIPEIDERIVDEAFKQNCAAQAIHVLYPRLSSKDIGLVFLRFDPAVTGGSIWIPFADIIKDREVKRIARERVDSRYREMKLNAIKSCIQKKISENHNCDDQNPQRLNK